MFTSIKLFISQFVWCLFVYFCYRLMALHHVIQGLLHILQVAIGYMLMLVVMTYNVWLFISIILGAGLGYVIFNYKRKLIIVDVNDPCHWLALGRDLVKWFKPIRHRYQSCGVIDLKVRHSYVILTNQLSSTILVTDWLWGRAFLCEILTDCDHLLVVIKLHLLCASMSSEKMIIKT